MGTITENKAPIEDSSFSLLTEPSYLVNDDMAIIWANEAFLNEFNLKAIQLDGKRTCEELCPFTALRHQRLPGQQGKASKKDGQWRCAAHQ